MSLDVEDRDEVARLRVPPHSLEAEQSVLGALLINNEAFERCVDLPEQAFYRHDHRLIFSAIVSLIRAKKEADVISVFEVLRDQGHDEQAGGLQYINALAQSIPNASNIRRYAEIVRDKSLFRNLVATSDEMATAAFNPQGATAADIADRMTGRLTELMKQVVRKAPRAIADIAIDRLQAYEDLADGKVVAGWRTHIPWLTATLNGGLRAGGLYILAARPSVGKSSFSQELGMQLAVDDLPTLFLSQEMADTEVADRGVSNMGRLSYSALLTGKMDRENWDRASEAMERMGRLPFYVDDQPSLTLQDIRIKAKSCKGLKVLILDYIQLCASTRKDGNRNSEIEEISRGLKSLAKELGIAIVALSQLNRDVEKRANKRPGLSDLRDSGAIEQDADVVMFLWPVREFQNEGRRIVGLGVDKNRQGRLGQVGLDFYGDVQRWTQSEADINHEPMARSKTGSFE